MARIFTCEELDELARPPLEQFARALDQGADVAVATFVRLEGRYHGFLEGFRDWIATIEAFVREGEEGAGQPDALDLDGALPPVLRERVEREDFGRVPPSGRGELEEVLPGGSRSDALEVFERMESRLRRRHDVVRDWLSGLLSHIYRSRGVDALEACLRFSAERTLLRWMPVDVVRPAERRIRQWAAMSLANFSRIHIDEDDEKFTITQDPCGSCTRQILDGACSPPLDLAVVGERHPITFRKGGVPVYRTHVAVMHYLVPIERTGLPWPVVLCPDGLETGPCRILLYKDPARTPAVLGERVAVGGKRGAR